MVMMIENAHSHSYARGTVEAVAERRVPARRPRRSHREKGQLRSDSGALVAIRPTRRCRRHRVQPGRSSPSHPQWRGVTAPAAVCLALASVELADPEGPDAHERHLQVLNIILHGGLADILDRCVTGGFLYSQPAACGKILGQFSLVAAIDLEDRLLRIGLPLFYPLKRWRA